jgi:hypothetical protein
MSIITRPSPYGYTLFCDDIRYEVNNKTTLVGNYNGVLVSLGPFPLQLPKLCLEVHYFQRFSDDAKDVEIQVFMPTDLAEKPSYSVVIKGEQIAAAEKPIVSSADEEDELVISAVIPIVLTPIVFDGPGKIMVRARRGDDTIKLGSLRIQQQPTA